MHNAQCRKTCRTDCEAQHTSAVGEDLQHATQLAELVVTLRQLGEEKVIAALPRAGGVLVRQRERRHIFVPPGANRPP